MEDTLMTAKEVAARLRLTRQTICTLTAAGRLPGINVTGAKVRPQWRFRRSDIEKVVRDGLVAER